MNDKSYQKQKTRPWLWMFIAGLFVVFAGGSGLWYVVAGQFEQEIERQKTRLTKRKQSLTCENQQVRGYPFRLGIFCDTVQFSDITRGLNVKSGALRTAAQFYAPGKVVAELDGPASVELGPTAKATFDWKLMRSSINANLDGVSELSIAGTDVDIALTAPLPNNLAARQLELHTRKSGENNIEVALGALHMDFGTVSGAKLDPVTLTMELTAVDLFEVAQRGGNILDQIKNRGAAGEITSLKLEPEKGGKLTVSGPWTVTNNGLIDATLAVELENTTQLLEFLKQAIPNQRDQISQIGLTLKALGGSNVDKPQTINLNIRENNVSIGLIPLGNFPPVF